VIHCHRIVTQFINSCEYIIYHDADERAWLIDCGEYSPVQQWLSDNNKTLAAVFLTHAHCDHTAGINDALKEWPDLVIYTSACQGIEYLQDPRLNQSRYFDSPFTVSATHCKTLGDGQSIPLYDGTTLTAWQTPGHSPDSLIYSVDSWLFTGDALIPGLEVVTRIKGADKLLAQKSKERILTMTDENTIILAGHDTNASNKNRQL